MADDLIITTFSEGVSIITLNRPDVLNSFTLEMASQLQRAFAEAATNAQVRAVLLTGRGRGFCAGQDLTVAVPADGSPPPDIGAVVRSSWNPIVRAIRTLEKPVVCAVNGVAAGAGANLAFACDLTIAAEEAVFVQSFAKLGLIPDTSGTFFIPRLVGLQRATGMMFLAGKISAARAKEWGLVWDVVPLATLQTTALALAKSLAAQATRGFGLTKLCLNHSLGADLEAQLEFEAVMMHAAGKTADYAEGVRAFLEKRLPQFRGE